MKTEEIERVYTRLHELQSVDIDHALERGRDYLIERLMDCRRRQDEAGQIAVRVKRGVFVAKVARRNALAAYRLSKTLADDTVYREAENAWDEMRALEESVSVCRATLRAADSDIRLAAGLLGMQILLGNPSSAPASDTAPPVVDVPATATAPSTSAPPSGLDAIFGGVEGTPSPVPPGPTTRPPSATVHVADAVTFDLDSLLSQ